MVTNRLKYILTLLLIIIPIKVSASNGYTIESYNVDIKVNKDNTYDIKETIDVNFSDYKHGIIRDIPLLNEVNRLDGIESKNYAKITNLKVSDKYSTSRSNDNYSIKIGNKNKTIIGKKTYKIEYTYNIGNDPLEDKDEFYFNIIGTNWDTSISNIKFKIEMPDDFDEEKLGFSVGKYGSTNNNLYYVVDGNVIKGYYNNTLSSYEGITVRLELKEGYFEKQKIGITELLMFIIPAIFVLIAILFWYKYGKDNKIKETVEFYPPEGFNSLEISYYYKAYSNTDDVISLLIYLANKGYLKIVESNKKETFSEIKRYEIVKVKNYDGDNENEKLFLKNLFKNKDVVTENDLYDSFYTTIDSILININKKENKDKIFLKTSSSKSKYMIFMIMAIFCIITIKPIVESGMISTLFISLLFPGLGFSLLIASFVNIDDPNFVKAGIKSQLGKMALPIIWGSMFGGIPWFFIVLPSLKINYLYVYAYIFGLICVTIILFCLKNLSKRTDYGNEMLGKIRGFKKFIEIAEKEKLEDIVMSNPTYFYDILPYTYVLGISDKWISKFESIGLQAPDWYAGVDSFNYNNFILFINETIKNITSAITICDSEDLD